MNARALDQGYLPTQMLPRLIDDIETRSMLRILDVGYGMPDTVEFFSAYRCQLHFCAIYEYLVSPEAPRDPEFVNDENLWFTLFQKAMPFAPGTQFDLCLFWDLLTYMNDAALRGFARALAPYVSTRTMAHAFAMLNTATSFQQREFGLLEKDRLTHRAPTSARPAPVPRGRSKVAELLKGFTVTRSVLHQGGMLEMILTGAPAADEELL